LLKSRAAKLTALTLVAALLFAGYTTYSAPRAFAELTVQVNPEIVLTLDQHQKVLAARFTGLLAHPTLGDLALVNLSVGEALDKVNAALTVLGLLTPDREVLIVVNPVGGANSEKVQGIAAAAEEKLKTHLKQQANLPPAVTSVLVSTPLTEVAQQLSIPLSSFARFLRKGVTEANLTAIMALQDGLKLDAAAFAQEFNKVVKSFADMREAGLPEDTALALLSESLQLDGALKNVYHLVSGLIDMHEAGLSPSDMSAALELHRDLKLSPSLLRRESDSLFSSLIDMHEVGVPSAVALSTLQAAMLADPSLKEIDTIVSALIDLVDKGATAEVALASINTAISADPTLKNLDGMLGLSPGRGRSDDDDDKNNENKGQGRRDKDDKSDDNDEDEEDQDDQDDQDKDDNDDERDDKDKDKDDDDKSDNKNLPKGRGRGN